MHVSQHGIEVTFEILLDRIEFRTVKRELNKGVVDKVFGLLAVVFGQAQSPIHQPVVTLNKQIFVTEGVDNRPALQHSVSCPIYISLDRARCETNVTNFLTESYDDRLAVNHFALE